MKATGMFFLRMHASVYSDTSGARAGVMLPVIERDVRDWKVILNTLMVRWKGADALAFYDAHAVDLRAGRPLQLELDRLRGTDGEWHATATHCELAPLAPSWQKQDGATAAAQPATSTAA